MVHNFRRCLLSFMGAVAFIFVGGLASAKESAKTETLPSVSAGKPVSWEAYLRNSAVPREFIDDFLHGPSWAQFDPELGYTLQNSFVPWGIDNSRTIETFLPSGARSRFLYAGRKPRINSYGDSFTESEQVSDGETWQEYLAGHLGEPIGNYGVGGYGVYQAYRRMVREEQTDHGADYVILYIWGDDPTRSLMRARWAAIYSLFQEQARAKHLFHANFWAHVEMDLASGRFVEKESPLRTPESLYKMCDPEWMTEALRDDLAVQLGAFRGPYTFKAPGLIADLDRKKISRLADILGYRFDWRDAANYSRQAEELLNLYSQRATIYILDKARAFTKERKKKLLIALNYTAWKFSEFSDNLPAPNRADRGDQLILDHLVKNGFDYFDMNEVHRLEHEKAMGTYHSYMRQYMVGGLGHYNPRGNHLFAYSIKDKLIEMLEPKPLPYQDRSAETVDFKGYLPGSQE